MSSRESEEPSLAHASAGAGITSVVVAATSLATALVISRRFGVVAAGELAIVLAPTAVLIRLSTLNEQAAFLRSASHLRARSTELTERFQALMLFSTALTALATALVVLATVVLFLGPVDRADLAPKAVVLALSYLVFENPSWNLDTLLTATQQTRSLVIARSLQALSVFVLTLLGSFISQDLWTLVIAIVLAPVIVLPLRISSGRRLLIAPHTADRGRLRSELRALFDFSRNYTGNTLVSALSVQAAPLVISGRTSPVEVGLFARSYGLTSRVEEVGFRFGGVFIADFAARRSTPSYRQTTISTLTTVLVAGSAVVAFTVTFADSILRVFGPDFVPGSQALRWLIVGATAGLANVVIQAVLVTSVRRPRLNAYLPPITQLLGFVLLFILTPRFGAVGAAMAVTASQVALTAGLVLATLRYRLGDHLRVPLLRLAVLAAFTGASFAGLRLVSSYPFDLVLGAAGLVLHLWVAGALGLVDLTALRVRLPFRKTSLAGLSE